jgi:hypothetical protein
LHGTFVRSNPVARRPSKLDELRVELVVARQNLVAAVFDRSPESLVGPLRNRVGDLLENIERLYSRDRLRRLD